MEFCDASNIPNSVLYPGKSAILSPAGLLGWRCSYKDLEIGALCGEPAFGSIQLFSGSPELLKSRCRRNRPRWLCI